MTVIVVEMHTSTVMTVTMTHTSMVTVIVVEMRTSTVMTVTMTHTSMVTVIVVEMRTSTVMNVTMTYTSVVTVIVVEMRTSSVTMIVIMMHTSLVTLMMMHTASHCLQHCKVCAKSQSADVVFYFICTHTHNLLANGRGGGGGFPNFNDLVIRTRSSREQVCVCVWWGGGGGGVEFNVGLRPQRPYGLLEMGSRGRPPPRLSHSS